MKNPFSRADLADPRPPAALAYGVAVVSVALAAAARFLLGSSLGGHYPFVTFFMAVALSAWYGGTGPALLALLLGALGAVYLFGQPQSSLPLSGTERLMGGFLYALVGLAITFFMESHRRSRLRAEARQAELEKVTRDLRQAQQALQESLERFRSLADSAPVMIWMSEPDTLCSYFNKPWLQFRGRTLEEELGNGWAEGVHPEDLQRYLDTYRAAFRAQKPFQMDYRLRRADGQYRWIQATGAPRLTPTGAFAGTIGSCVDITERRQAGEQLKREQERLRLTLSSIGDGVITTDESGRVILLNAVAEALTGWKQEEAAGRPLEEVFRIVNEKTRLVAENPVRRVIQKGVIVGLANHTLLVARDGTERAIDDSAAPIRGDGDSLWGVILVFRDVTERRRAEEVGRRLAAIVDSSDDAIVGKTLDGIIQSWNAGAERIFGYREEEVVGRPITILIPADRPDEETEIVEKLKQGQRVDHFETVRVRKDGETIHVSLTISPIKDAEGNIVGASKIARDITARKRADEEREQLLARERSARLLADRANRMKDEFLATLSHELRTPLNAILGWAHLLGSGKLQAQEARHGVAVIERNARNQAQLIDDLLDMSRIISGKVHLEVERVELRPVIEAALEAVAPAVQAKEISLERDLDPETGPVTGDPTRLQQVVWNLLTNAIKFTPQRGRVRVSLKSRGSRVEIMVSDNGVGISPQFLPHVFERFRQADPSTTRQFGGLGLGLAIVRHLVEAHGGTVRAESPGEGKGATFVISLPLPRALLPESLMETGPVRAVGGKPPSGIPVNLKGVKVLVVDDDPDTLELLKRVLEESEAEVSTASSSAEAVELLSLHSPQVLVSDIGMPVEDGFALIKRVRHELRSSIPAVALTAYARAEDRERVLRSGFQAHLPKPIQGAELVAALAGLLVAE